MASWDRQPKEPPKAYLHFTIYRDLGPERTLAKVGKTSGVSAALCEAESAEWNWVARCDQWDAHVQAIHDRAFLNEAAKRGKKRASAFMKLLDKSLTALEGVDTSECTLKDVAGALKIASEGMRLEEGLETKRVVQEVTDARTALSHLPPEVRRPLLRALAEHARSERPGRAAGGVPLGLDGDGA